MLPPISPGNNYEALQNENVERLERMMQKHFSTELDIVRSSSDVDAQIEKINQAILQQLQESTNEKTLIKEKIESFKANLKGLNLQKHEYRSKHIASVEKRNDILAVSKQPPPSSHTFPLPTIS